jgi:hypothetical protein
MSTLQDGLDQIKLQKDTYIIPGNIKKDVTVFGVTGTLESGAQGVALYESVALMLADTTQDEGTYGVVASTNFEGVYRYLDNNWVIVGDPVEALTVFNDLSEVLGSDVEYEGLGGTEQEIEEILEEVINGSQEGE